jgi:4-hydroxythreonine-4-phosphate dehydrogenase
VSLLGITLGDPAGVGAEVLLKAVTHARAARIRCVVIGDLDTLRETARRLRLHIRVLPVGEDELPALARVPRAPGALPVLTARALPAHARRPGRPTRAGGRAAYRWIETAARLAVAGGIDGIVTAPISKEVVTRAGFPITGHTELLRSLTGARDVRMMLAGRRLRVVLVTMHMAYRAVPQAIRGAAVLRSIVVADAHLRRYHRMSRPRLAVAGLNPHAGEGGLFGTEERTVIEPSVKKARRAGIAVSGPYPPDTLFFRAVAGEFDAVIAMYHDQGLIPLKLLHFHDAVNVTMGLPIVRTSPDHGTAYDIAGRGVARETSMVEAITLAARMARQRRQGTGTRGREAR